MLRVSSTKTWSSLLTQKQQSVKGDFDDVKELLDFTEFLCYEPYAVGMSRRSCGRQQKLTTATGHHTGEAPSLQGRMLVFLEEDTSEELTKRFQLFRSKKHELSAPDFKVWCEAKNDEHEKRRQWGRHLQEFAVIRELCKRKSSYNMARL